MAKVGPYLTISEAARILGISPSSLRNWETIGLIRPLRTQGRYRMFSREILDEAKRVRYLRRVKRLNPHAILHLRNRHKRGGSKARRHRGVATPVGRRLLLLRKRHRLSLTDAARKAGISPSFLSAIERDHANPSVATFQKLSKLYNTTVLSFFGHPYAGTRRLIRRGDRPALQPDPGVRIEQLAAGNTIMECQLWRIAPGGGSGGSYDHEGEEFLYVLKGELQIWLDEVERYVVRPGDSLYFESMHAHRWTNNGKTETVLLWVNTPPTF
jgi:transcriptional regulator with XRE-family HTH domain